MKDGRDHKLERAVRRMQAATKAEQVPADERVLFAKLRARIAQGCPGLVDEALTARTRQVYDRMREPVQQASSRPCEAVRKAAEAVQAARRTERLAASASVRRMRRQQARVERAIAGLPDPA